MDPLESILPPLLGECAIQVEGLQRLSRVESTLGPFRTNLTAAENAHSELKRLYRGAHCGIFHSDSGACSKTREYLRQIERAKWDRSELSGGCRTGWSVGGLMNEDRICPASILLHRSVRKQVPIFRGAAAPEKTSKIKALVQPEMPKPDPRLTDGRIDDINPDSRLQAPGKGGGFLMS